MEPLKRTIANGNITRVVPVNLMADGDFEDVNGFFVRASTAGYLRYIPIDNADNEYIDKYFDASEIFIDPEVVRKIINLGQVSPAQASNVYVGYGV